MIAAWMLFAIEISALLFAAAWIAERALLAPRRPVRVVWMAAIVAANFLPLLLSRISYGSEVAKRWSLVVAPGSALTKISTPLLVLWTLAVAVGLFVCIAALWRMSRTRSSWKHEHVNSTPVLVSHDIGPALVGVLHYSIVIPTWAYALEERARALLLTHEREHARHYDPLLLAAAVLAVVIAPWNVFNWLFLKRLHLAVELDCDQRVLRKHPDARGYGALLLDVAERVLPSVMTAAAFVEHGTSLETRLNAMTEHRNAPQSLRVITGFAASVMFAAAACFTPRPYAVVIVVPAASTQAMVSPPAVPPASAPVSAQGGAQALKAQQLAGADPSVRVTAPSAQTQALDALENERMRRAVLGAAPGTLESWPRSDSALVLLFDADRTVVKHITVATKELWNSADPSGVFTQLFMPPEIAALEFRSEVQISQGTHGDTLAVPLRLFVGRLRRGATIPLTRAEVVPAHAAMVATLRDKYPELLKDTTANPMVGGLLFGSHGELLATASIRMDVSQTLPDGSSNPDYDSIFFKRAFGSLLDSGVVVQNARLAYFDDSTPRDGKPRLIYAVLVKRSQFKLTPSAASTDPFPGMVTWSASRYGATSPEPHTMSKRLLGLVRTRVPDAFGAWPRADSAIAFLFDEDDQLVARRIIVIPGSDQLSYIAKLFSQQVVGLRAADVEAVGIAKLTSSPSGREVTPALYVVWGRSRRTSAPGDKQLP